MSPPATPFELAGYEDRPLPCVLHATGDERVVAVVLPGAAAHGYRLGGTPARPDLHYARTVLRAEGVAVLETWWDADTIPDDDVDGWLDAHVDAALAAATKERALGFVVGRSLGTMALARVVSRHTWPERAVPTIWLAPLLVQDSVSDALAGLASPALVVGGSADRAFGAEELGRLRASESIELVVLEGANHGLEVDDPAASVQLLAQVVETLTRFVRAHAA